VTFYLPLIITRGLDSVINYLFTLVPPGHGLRRHLGWLPLDLRAKRSPFERDLA
jgi:hypothetical protein